MSRKPRDPNDPTLDSQQGRDGASPEPPARDRAPGSTAHREYLGVVPGDGARPGSFTPTRGGPDEWANTREDADPSDPFGFDAKYLSTPSADTTTGQPTNGGAGPRRPMEILPGFIDVGPTFVGGERREIFRVRSAGEGEVRALVEPLAGVQSPDHEAFRANEQVVNTMGLGAGAVTFKPSEARTHQAVLRVQSEDGRDALAMLQGVAQQTDAEACGPDGSLAVTGHEKRLSAEDPRTTVTIMNTCGGTINLSNLQAVEGDEGDFEIYPPGLPAELQPGQSVQVVVEFKAVTASPRTELTFLVGSDVDGVTAEFSVVGERENFLDRDSDDRKAIVAAARDHIGAAREQFGLACVQKQEDLREEASDHGFMGIAVDVILGTLAPGVGGALIGAVVAGLPNTNLANRLGAALVDNETTVVDKIISPLGDKVKSALSSTSGERDLIKALMIHLNKTMTNLQTSCVGRSDTELLNLAALYHPDVANVAIYGTKLNEYVERYRSEVKPVGREAVPMTRLGGSGGKITLAWLADEGGNQFLAQGFRSAGLLSDARGEDPSGDLQFRAWVAPDMAEAALTRAGHVDELHYGDADIKPSEWLGRFDAARKAGA